jgi:hypothetical protein
MSIAKNFTLPNFLFPGWRIHSSVTKHFHLPSQQGAGVISDIYRQATSDNIRRSSCREL